MFELRKVIGMLKSLRASSLVLPIVLLTSGFFLSESTWAAINCGPSDVYPPETSTPSINVTTSYTGEDIPVGSTIYRVRTFSQGIVGVACDAPFSLDAYTTISNEPYGPPVNINTQAFGTGPVYPTNINGVGVGVTVGNQLVSLAAPVKSLVLKNDTAASTGSRAYFDIALIKTGPIASGSVVNVSSFPDVSYEVLPAAGYTGLPVRMLTLSFSGSVNFLTSTCTTPDVVVDMGQYEVSKYFKGSGSFTPWKDASIALQNCPTFSGYHSDSTAQQTVGSSANIGTARTANSFTVHLVPRNAVTGNAVNVDSSADAATGVGIQLGYTNDVDANPTTPQTIWTPGMTWVNSAPTDGRSAVKIPLAARYYQFSSEVTPGKANSKVEFQIDYK
jgi:type 1 fimbria pilin